MKKSTSSGNSKVASPPDEVPREMRAEQNVLACLLTFSRDAGELFSHVRHEHFFDGAHPAIFRAFVELLESGQPCLAGDVAELLRRQGKQNEANAALALESTCGSVPVSLAKVELDKLNEAVQKRRIFSLARELQTATLNGRKAQELLAEARERLASIEADGGAPLASRYREALLTAGDLDALSVTPRSPILGRWFCAADLGFVYAQRGVGKTWLSLLLARGAAGGEAAGPWPGYNAAPARVLYVDGEMPLELLKARQRGLGIEGGGVTFLSHEHLFDRTGQILNLSDPESQRDLTRLCLAEGYNLLILDNLSCLFRGVSENDADAWEMVLPWLLDLRRQGIAVLIVAHAGRNNAMRGTSRREDAAAWTIRLDSAFDGAGPKNGAKFVSSFTKPSRNTPENLPPLEWTVTTDAATGRSTVAYKEAEGEEVVLSWVRNGLSSCSEIAVEMGVSNGTVSKMAKQLIEAGKLKKEGRGYALPILGDEAADDDHG